MDGKEPSLVPGLPSCLNILLKHCSDRLGCEMQLQTCISSEQWFLQGGPDPLDYIFILKNGGNRDSDIPKHFHYVGFGLTDIHNYKQFCEMCASIGKDSLPQVYPPKRDLNGYGFELTFRLRCRDNEEWDSSEPPKWPIQIMQDLASYAFRTKHSFGDGDHTAWHCPLSNNENSRIKHIFMTLDPVLQVAQTAQGLEPIKFIQLVGVCQEELEAARKHTVRSILDMMSNHRETGGQYLITDMARSKTIFELDPENAKEIDTMMKAYGSDIALINVEHKYSAWKPKWFKDAEMSTSSEIETSEQENHLEYCDKYSTAPGVGERGSLLTMNRDNCTSHPSDQQSIGSRTLSRMSLDSESEYRLENVDLTKIRSFDSIYLLFQRRSAKLLTTVLEGRLAHGATFTFSCNTGNLATTFIPESHLNQFPVSKERPFAKQSIRVYVYISVELRCKMLTTLKRLDFDALNLPKNLSWPEYNLHITVIEDEVQTYFDE